jgi:hypothetical protein
MKGLFVGICNSQKKINSSFFWSVMGIKPPYPNFPIHLFRAKDKLSVIRNNKIIKGFLDSSFDYFVKMDVDQIYPFNYFEVMVPLIDKYKVIAPLIFDRWRSNNFCPLAFESIEYNNAIPIDITGKTGIESIEYAHTNCFFHREVLENIEPPWHDIELSEDRMSVVNNGDRYFINKLNNAGYKTYINFDVVVRHDPETGGIDREFFERWNRS